MNCYDKDEYVYVIAIQPFKKIEDIIEVYRQKATPSLVKCFVFGEGFFLGFI